MIVRQISDALQVSPIYRKAGFVTQIFSQSINCKLGEALLHISGREDFLAPFGLTLDAEDFSHLKNALTIGDLICPSSDGYVIYSQSSVFELSCWQAKVRRSDLPTVALNVLTLDLLQQNWEQLLVGYASRAKTHYALSLRLRHAPSNQLLPCFKQLLGRGEGLTPSGDDIILGFCALAMTGAEKAFYQSLLRALDLSRTTHVSAAYLQALAQNRVSSILRNYLIILNEVKSTSFVLLSQQILNFGHHSGRDILWGMLLALYRQREKVSLWQNVSSH